MARRGYFRLIPPWSRAPWTWRMTFRYFGDDSNIAVYTYHLRVDQEFWPKWGQFPVAANSSWRTLPPYHAICAGREPMASVPCFQCGGSGKTNYGGCPMLCSSCGGNGLVHYGPRGGGSSGGGASRPKKVSRKERKRLKAEKRRQKELEIAAKAEEKQRRKELKEAEREKARVENEEFFQSIGKLLALAFFFIAWIVRHLIGKPKGKKEGEKTNIFTKWGLLLGLILGLFLVFSDIEPGSGPIPMGMIFVMALSTVGIGFLIDRARGVK